MNQKEFMQKADEILSNMGMEELRRCLDNVVRKVPENKRETFLQLIDNCRDSERKEKGNKLHKGFISDEKVKETLTTINNAFAQIEDGDLCISANGYEDYSNGYWTSDWIWEYEDNDGIGKIIEDAILFAHDCMNDCRYEEALTVFKLVMDTQVSVVDQGGGDSSDLDLEGLVDEKLAGINLRVFALEVLYTGYQLQSKDKRAVSLYSYFSYPYFREIHIEDIFSVGIEELKDTDIFWESWIDLLMQQSGEVAARLLKEAILYHKGIAGILEMARIGYKEHASLFLAALLECEKAHDYEKMKEVGIEALEKLGHDLKIRGEIAIKTAQASYCVNDSEIVRKCWYEAFYSNSSVVNYLRLGGKYRSKYGDVALLAAALGEVEESLGMKTLKSIINGYHEKYVRYSAFRGALKEYV